MKGLIVKDWSQVAYKNPEHRGKVFGALQHFCNLLEKDAKVRRALQRFSEVQNFGTQNDFPESVLQVLEKFHHTSHFDTAYEKLFAIRDYTSSQRNGFEIRDVTSGLTFEEVPLGEKVKIAKMAGVKTTVTFARYGGGLGWARELFDDRDYWTIEDNAIAFVNKYGYSKALVFYTLLEAISSGRNIAWASPVPAGLAATDANYVAVRDMETINAACLDVLTKLKDKDYGVTASTQFELLAPVALKGRISRALGLLNSGLAGGQNGVHYNVSPNFTLMFANQAKYYIGVPGQKNIIGNRMNLTTFDQFDPTSYSDIAVGWARYGGAIGDEEQLARCATS